MPIATLIRRAREQADFLALHAKTLDALSYETATAAHPDKPHDEISYVYPPYSIGSYSLSFGVYGPDSKAIIRKLRRAFAPGKWDKQMSGESLYLRREIDDISVEITASREAACTRIETDEVEEYTETVRMTQAEYEASQIDGEATVIVKRPATRPVTRWQCS